MNVYIVTAFLVTTFLPPLILSETGGWNNPANEQYHIQTDEGPERYFRYQTHSGQYRKEKRLEDGTVIGTYGWIDQNGMLRLREYIADNAGYRILKSKNVYVGKDRPIGQAVKAAKKVPAVAGTLVKPAPSPIVPPPTPYVEPPSVYQTTPAPPTPIYKELPCADCNNLVPGIGYTPNVQISPNSFPSSTEKPFISTTPSTIGSSTYGPPSSTPAPEVFIHQSTPATVYIPSTSPGVPSSTPSYGGFISSTPSPHSYESPTPASVSSINYGTSTPSSVFLASPKLPPQINSNSLDFSGYSSDPQYEHYESNTFNPYVFRNGPTYPIDKNGNTFTGYNTNNIGSGYNYQDYDGVSVTNDGFRYYIPRAYHEEQHLPGDRRAGSFGYVDPFGIRRVVYYNAAPGTGFLHRKNNRYVGFNAPPFDPRPY